MRKALSCLIGAFAVFLAVTASHAQLVVTDPENLVADFGCEPVGGEGLYEIAFRNDYDFAVLVELRIEADDAGFFEVEPLPLVLGPGDQDPDVPIVFSPESSAGSSGLGDFDATLLLQVRTLSGELIEVVPLQLYGTGGISGDLCSVGEIIEFLETAVFESHDIVGTGNGNQREARVNAMLKRLETIDFLINNGNINAAIAVANSAINRCDGDGSPGDFIQDGEDSEADATQTINYSLLLLVDALGG